jgi:hypothetical protein
VKKFCFFRVRCGHTSAVFGEGGFHRVIYQTSSARDIPTLARVWVAEKELTAPPSFRVEQLLSQRVTSQGKNPSKRKFAGVLIRILARFGHRDPPKE